ncbi:rhomboid family intramembrane serine protease [Ciceribacter sp. L1K23]|uniref:rhomboid family intramembrane serine protease n=1 Tax=Ciceribacter sp. L1K23 TaxID=2820276 RepID=UPI001B81E3C1|nr:rhomboid family intramembrane serine protease [Ciceribacter sp. L1K23]MBR0555691.1 rhomboid family intramembrane serine protease [Ciceribacter sp. L1K23]
MTHDPRDDNGAFGGRGRGGEPVFNLPTGILAAMVLLAGIYVLQAYVLSPDAAQSFVFTFAFSPLRYVYPLSEQGLEWLWTPVTYSLLHGSIEHIAFNSLWLAAFGTPVFRRIGGTRFMAFWVFSAAAGAALHAAVNWGQPTFMIGASAVVSALMGAACRFALGPGSRLSFGHLRPRLTIAEALADRTVRVFAGVWFLGNILIAVGLPLIGDVSGSIAWDAHIGGFLFGFLLFSLFDPQR